MIIWNLKIGEQVIRYFLIHLSFFFLKKKIISPPLSFIFVIQIAVLENEEIESEVTVLCLSPDGQQLAVGYFDGTGRLWIAFGRERICKATFTGHRKEISSLSFNGDGTLLVSGSSDTELVIWDIMNEMGLYRLKGHKDRITHTKFLVGNRLVSSSKDTLLKIWDLETQSCIQTLVGHKHEVWCFDINKEETRLVAASSDDNLRVWKIPPLNLNGHVKKNFLIIFLFIHFNLKLWVIRNYFLKMFHL